MATRSLWIWLVIAAAPLWGAALRTDDGLVLSLGDQGQVAGIAVGETKLDVKPGGGFYVLDVATGQREVLRAAAQTKNGVLSQSGPVEALGLTLDTACASSGQYLSFSAKVQDTTGRDRAIELGYEIPLSALDCTWADDLVKSRRIADPISYSHTCKSEAGAGQTQIYPFTSLSRGGIGLTLGVGLAQGPRVYTIEYDNTRGCLLIRFHFGLSAKARKLPGQAWCSFLLYRHDGNWGLRAAADKYYRLFPKDFEKRVPYEGYLGYADLETQNSFRGSRAFYGLQSPGDFGRGFRWIWHQHTTYGALYFDWPNEKHPDDESVYRMLKEKQATLHLKKLYTDAEGKIVWVGDSKYTPPQGDKPGQWLLNFQLNEDPEVSSTLKESLEKALETWERDNPKRAPYTWCISNDGTGYVGRHMNFREDHLAVTDVPLTYDAATKKVALSDQAWEFNTQVLKPLAAEHKFLMLRNFTWGTPNHGANIPFFDIGLIECKYKGWGWDEDSAIYSRLCANRRVLRYWAYLPYDATRPQAVREMFNRGLVYAIYPHLLSDADQYRDLYTQFVPVMEQLSGAGWEPVTHARCSDALVRVERYGRVGDSNLAFAFRNTGTDRRRCRVIIDDELGLPARPDQLEVRDLLTGRSVAVQVLEGRLALSVDLPAGEATAYSVLPRPRRLEADLRAAAEALRQAAQLSYEEVTYQPSRPGSLLQGDTPAGAEASRILSDGWWSYQGLIWQPGEPLEINLDLNSGHRLQWLRVHYGFTEAYEAPQAVIEGRDREGNWIELGKVPAAAGTGTISPLVELNPSTEYQLLRLKYPALKKMLWIKEIELVGTDGALERAAQRFEALAAQREAPDPALLSQLTIALRVRRMVGSDKTLQERALDYLAEVTAVASGVRAVLDLPPDAPAEGSVAAQIIVTNSGRNNLRDGNVKLKLPPGWSAAPGKFDLTVPAGQTVRLPVNLVRTATGRITLLTTGLVDNSSIFMSRQQ
ncbi:MAG: NEW3 domain-containing protein [Armatimonadia bacterium]